MQITQAIKEWAVAVCGTCIVGAMLSMLTPAGGSRRMLQMILTLMTLCVLFRPVSAAREWVLHIESYSFDREQYRNEELEAEVERSAKDVYASYLEENLSRVLDGEGIPYKMITVTMDNSDDGCISIGQVEVIVKNEDAENVEIKKKIKERLRDYIGFDAADLPRLRCFSSPIFFRAEARRTPLRNRRYIPRRKQIMRNTPPIWKTA